MKCEVCRDTGWKSVASEKGPKAVRCDCQQRLRNERLLKHAAIPERYKHCELANFEHQPPFGTPALARAHMVATQFVDKYPVEKTGLLFIGDIGVGKTHLAVGIIHQLMLQKGVECLFCDYRELLKEIQNSYNTTVAATEMDVLRPVFEAEVLVLDELGAVRTSEWVWDTVSLILNSRYNASRTTIITTNYSNQAAGKKEDGSDPKNSEERSARKETLGDRIGDRMRSRLHEMCRIVSVEGEDFRIKWKSASYR